MSGGSMLYIYMLWYVLFLWFFFFKQNTAYEMRISDWSSDVCSSDLAFADQVETMVEELAKKGHPAIEGCGQALIGCDVGNDQAVALHFEAVIADYSVQRGLRRLHALGRRLHGLRRLLRPATRGAARGRGVIGSASGRERVWTYVYVTGVAAN